MLTDFPEPALYPPVHAFQAQQWSTWPSEIQSPWKEEWSGWGEGLGGGRGGRGRERRKSEGREERGAGMAAHREHRTSMPFLLTLSPTSTPEAITSDSKYIFQDMAIKGTFACCHSLLMYWWLHCWLRFTNSFRINILYSIPCCSYKNYQGNIIVMV